MRSITHEINGSFQIHESAVGVFFSALLLFLPFFIFRISWGIDNQFQSLFTHIPQAAVILAICLLSLAHLRANKRQAVITAIFSGLLLIHFIQSVNLIGSLPGYDYDYFLQGVLLWAYLFAVCLYASTIKIKDYPRFLHIFDLFAKAAILVAILFFLLYKLTGIALLVHFYEGFELVRIQGFFSEPSAFAPVACWLLLSGIRYRNLTNVGLAMIVCVLAFSPIVIISTLLALVTYLIIFHPRITPLIFVSGVLIAVWITLVDCSVAIDGSSLNRAACGVKAIFSEDTRAVFANDRLLSSIVIFEHLAATGSWVYGLGINSTSVFMPAYFGVMRDNSLPISIIAFYGAIGGLVFVLFVAVGLYMAWKRKNIYSIFWISFFWCSMINSAQGFITYALLFVASIWLFSHPSKNTSLNN